MVRILKTVFLVTLFNSPHALAELLSREAVYEIPMSNLSQSEQNKFNLSDMVVEKTDSGTVTIKYSLPMQLTGKRNTFTFSGKIGQKMIYEGHRMDCKQDSESLVCSVRFSNLNIDKKLAKRNLKKKIGDGDLSIHVAVLEKFWEDPVGVLRIKEIIPKK